MTLKKLVLFAAASGLAVPALLLAQAVPQVEPAVQPGGDIPRHFRPVMPVPKPTTAAPLNPDRSVTQYVRRELMVPMRDGVRLHTVLILPSSGPSAAGRYPLIVDRTPYSADRVTAYGGGGPLPENILSPLYAELVRAGYIVAVQDVRGKFRSEGEYVMNRPLRGPLNPTSVDHSTDAWDTIDQLLKSVSEANGRAAAVGTSYDGFTALMSLVGAHPALKAVVAINPMVDVWKGDDWFHNGAFRQEMIGYIYGQTAARSSGGDWFRSAADDYHSLLRHGSAGAYARSLGMEALPFWRRLSRHPAYDSYWQQQALDRIFAVRPPGVPTMIVGGLWDQEDSYGAPALFNALKRGGNAWLVLGPWHHAQAESAGFALGPLIWGEDTAQWFRKSLLLPFLDERMKGGARAALPRVSAFAVGPNRWESLPDWPPACARGCATGLVPLYLTPGRKLGFTAPPGRASDSYISDPARPVPYRWGPTPAPFAAGSSWRQWLVDDQRFAEARSDVLSYSTAPLDKPLSLKGTPLAHLLASTSGSDSDWVVKLIDVYPLPDRKHPEMSGYQLPIAMEIFRGRYRTDPARPQALVPNQPLTYEFALPAVDYVVPAGHRLMVQVQSSWFPLYDRNPQSFVPNIFFARPGDYRPATQRLFTGPGASWIGLPVAN